MKKVYVSRKSGMEWYEEPIITPALYEDGTMLEVNSKWRWEDIDYAGWNEEEDCGIIPEGWWENRHFNQDDVYNNIVDKEVIAWMPLPEPYRGERMRTLEEILTDGIKDTDWTYCKAEYAPHEGCKIGMPTEYTPDGTTKLCVKTCYIVTAKFCDDSIVSSPDFMYLSDGRFYWYDNLWDDTDTVDQEKTDELWNTPIAWIAYRNVAECERPYPLAPYNKDANIPTPQKYAE